MPSSGAWRQGAIPPFTLNFLRWALALVILYPFVARRLREDWPLVRTHLRLLTVTSLSITLYNALQYLALITSSPINIAPITALGPDFYLADRPRLFTAPASVARQCWVPYCPSGALRGSCSGVISPT